MEKTYTLMLAAYVPAIAAGSAVGTAPTLTPRREGSSARELHLKGMMEGTPDHTDEEARIGGRCTWPRPMRVPGTT